MKAFVLLIVLTLVGCSSNAGRVKCDGRLEPINAPAPVVKQAPGRAAASKE